LLAKYYDRYRCHHLVQSRHNRKIMRYKLRKYFHWYRRGVQNIKSLYDRVAMIRKRSVQSVKLRLFLEWFYLYRKRNYYSYICEIIYRKRILMNLNKWIVCYESSKLVKLKNIVQRKRDLRIQREYFQAMWCMHSLKRIVTSRMLLRKLFNALHCIIVYITSSFIRQKDMRVAGKHFIAYIQWKYLSLWSSKQIQKKLRCISAQQIMRKVSHASRSKHFYYLMNTLSRKCTLRRQSIKLLRQNATMRREKWCKVFFSILLQQIRSKNMTHVSHYLLQWRRYNNHNRLRRESFVQKLNKMYMCSYFTQLRKYSNYQAFKKVVVLYLKLSRQRNYLRVWIMAYQRTVRARVKIMDIFFTTRMLALKYTFIHWQINAKHFERLQQLYCSSLASHVFAQWLTLKNAILFHRNVLLRHYFHRLKCVKVILYKRQQRLLRKRKFYKIFSAMLKRFASKGLTRLFNRWKQNTEVGRNFTSSAYSTHWK